MADFYSIKTRDGETVPKILNKEKGIVFDGINILQEALTVGTPIFIVLGGDRPKWDTGLIGIGIVTEEPFDKGYDEKNKNNFKIKIDMKVLLNSPIKREDLIPYRETYGIIAIGPVLKGEPNQALTTMSSNQAVALMRAMAELCPGIKIDIEQLVGDNLSKSIFGVTKKMVEIPFEYGESEESALMKFASNDGVDLKAREKEFSIWLGNQKKSNGDPYPERTISGYCYALRAAGKKLEDFSFVESNLFFYTDYDEMCEINDKIRQCKNYDEVNHYFGNGQLSAGLLKYLQYLESYSNSDNGIEEDSNEQVKLSFRTGFDSDYEHNRIIFGAPGTGKSFTLNADADKLVNDKETDMERVTFHPDYTYSQFVGTYKPAMKGDEITYEFVPGPFMRIYVKALKSGRNTLSQPYLLLVEEINRAKVAAVFGDMFQLLDRDEYGVSEYDIQASEDVKKYLAKELGGKPDNYSKIRIPDNMFIWATMNSADQGVFPMDTAFKRRWNFEYLGINENDKEVVGTIQLGKNEEAIDWNRLRKAINDKLAKEYKVNEDKLMGPYFIAKKLLKVDENGVLVEQDKFIKTFKSKVIMYLYEDAAKQHKHKLFEGCDSSKYSSVCDAFDEIGIRIFGESFKENYYDQQEG